VSRPVLDASALLAYLRDEPGADIVAEAVAGGATLSTVNLAEVLTIAADRGADPRELTTRLTRQGLLGGAVVIEELTVDDAVEIARLRPPTREWGLSLGDRACLTLARRLGAPALTADRAWRGLDLGVTLEFIR
jgi:PIN domain nuclease of toxin-antitoxin system